MEGKRSGFYAGNPDNDYSNRGSINSTIFYLQKIKPFGYLVSADCPILFAKPFYTFMMRQSMMGIPLELSESAMIDGCNVWKRFLYIVLPQSKPALLAVMIMAMQDQWNNYLEPLIYINSNSKQTISVGLTFLAECITFSGT